MSFCNIAITPLVLALLLGLAGCATEEELALGRPYGSGALTQPIPEGTLYLFRDSGFRGDVTRIDTVASVPAGTVQSLNAAGGVTSLRWKLDPGVLVVLYEQRDAKGNQIPLWGEGQVSSLSQWRSNDQVSAWAWYHVGTASAPAAQAQAATPPRPLGAMPTGAIVPGVIELYRDSNFRGTLTTLGPIGQVPTGDLRTTGAASDQMSSLRWSLPSGVVVVLYEDAQGKGRQLTLFGTGEYPSVSPWNFNDKVSRWAWYDLGAMPASGQ